MEYRALGGSGLRVSAAGLGCNNFGGRCDATATNAIVHKALDLGVTLYDTANVYGERGGSEELLGKALGSSRQSVVVATKFGMAMGDAPHERGGSRRHIMEAVEASLRRLGTDYIDLYQIHFPDPETPIDETLRALDDLVRTGKVRYLGCSNFAAWQLADAAWVSRIQGLERFVSAQNFYNLLDRRIERELVPACRAHYTSILPYFPLASGFLTGKYTRQAPQPEGARLSAHPARDGIMTEANFDRIEKLEAYATGRGRTLLDLAIGWLASQPHVASVISGATRTTQLEQNVQATDWLLSAEELEAVDVITKRS